jgi:hypothetical protein
VHMLQVVLEVNSEVAVEHAYYKLLLLLLLLLRSGSLAADRAHLTVTYPLLLWA